MKPATRRTPEPAPAPPPPERAGPAAVAAARRWLAALLSAGERADETAAPTGRSAAGLADAGADPAMVREKRP
jgi:hypothetical protein